MLELFGIAPFTALWNERISDTAVLLQEVLKNPIIKNGKRKGVVKLAEFLVEFAIMWKVVRLRVKKRAILFLESNVEFF